MKRIAVLFRVALVALPLLFGGCAGKRVSVWMRDTADGQKAPDAIYYLPESRLDFRFILELERHTPGPFSDFAERMLGVQVPLEGGPTERWRLISVTPTVKLEPDHSLAFVARIPEECTASFLTLTEGGFLLPSSYVASPIPQDSPTALPDPLAPYLDLSTEQFIADQQSIYYSTVQRDSTFVRVPVQRTVVVKQSLEEKAKQAADLIFSLRRKRVELITGELELPPAAGAVERMLDEIDRLEAKYLSLFIGIHERQRVERWVSYTPQFDTQMEILCRFSPTGGLLPTSELSASPVTISFSPIGNAPIPALAPYSRIKGAYYYRMPRLVEVSVMLRNEQLTAVRLPIAQMGAVVTIPTGSLQ